MAALDDLVEIAQTLSRQVIGYPHCNFDLASCVATHYHTGRGCFLANMRVVARQSPKRSSTDDNWSDFGPARPATGFFD